MAAHPEAPSRPPLRRALLLVNKRSRNGQCDLSPIIDRLAARGLQCTVQVTHSPEEFHDVVAGHAPGVDAVLVGGGDGTINAALGAVMASGLPLGILPLGTANDLARTLRIPADLDAACDIIADGRVGTIDLGWVNGRHFLNVASLGLAVQVTQALDAGVKRRWGALGYGLTALRMLRAAEPFIAEVRCNGHVHRLRSIQVAVGNGRHYGGGMTIHADASIDDGRLDLYSLRPMSAWKLASLVPAMRRGHHGRRDEVDTLHGHRIDVHTDPELPINTDGEITTRTPAHFRVLPGALPVLMPGPT